MPKITVFGGHSDISLKGFNDDTEATKVKAKAKTKDAAVTPEPVKAAAIVKPVDSAPELPFDPSELSVTDVLALLQDCDEAQRAAVLEAERNGRNRSGIVGK